MINPYPRKKHIKCEGVAYGISLKKSVRIARVFYIAFKEVLKRF